MFLMSKSSTVLKQLEAAGYGLPEIGTSFTFEAGRWMASWLSLGAQMGVMFHGPPPSDADQHKTYLTYLFWSVVATPGIHFWESKKGVGGILGLELGLGGQAVFWTLNKKTETGASFRFSSALKILILRRGPSGGFRIGFYYADTEKLGPLKLSLRGFGVMIEAGLSYGI